MSEFKQWSRTQSDINLTALAIEAERRRKKRGLIRYNCGDLVAEITTEERQRIIDDYRKKLNLRKGSAAGERFQEPDDKQDMRSIREKRDIPEEVPLPPQEEVRTHRPGGRNLSQAGALPGLRPQTRERGVISCSDLKSPCPLTTPPRATFILHPGCAYSWGLRCSRRC